MGLTVTYRFGFRGTKAELLKRLEGLRERFKKLRVAWVGDVLDVRGAEMEPGYGRYEGDKYYRNALGFMMLLSHFESTAADRAMGEIIRGAGGIANLGKLPPAERRRYDRLQRKSKATWEERKARIAASANGVGLIVDPGPGCEYFQLWLGRLGGGRLWRGTRFTKTQYAEHFVDAHLRVIAMLDACKEAGILESVHDEGGYWETRDLEVLAKNINAYTDLIRAVSGKLGEAGRAAGWQTSSAIDRSINYMRVLPKPGGKSDS